MYTSDRILLQPVKSPGSYLHSADKRFPERGYEVNVTGVHTAAAFFVDCNPLCHVSASSTGHRVLCLAVMLTIKHTRKTTIILRNHQHKRPSGGST